MAVVSMKQFLEAGVHFGHQTRRWNPKMSPYIFGAKHHVHIIDLQKTLRCLKGAYDYVRDLSAKGSPVLFVGTKTQAKEIIREEAQRSGSFFINERWLGGLMTNFNTIRASINTLRKLNEQRGEDGLYPGMIKKEALRTEKHRIKLHRSLGGIAEMRKLPGALFVIDCRKEKIAIEEAQKLGIPIVAVVDTNCNPDGIDYVIPGNDDSIRAIRLFSATIANAVIEGRGLFQAQARSAEPEQGRGQPREGGRGNNPLPAKNLGKSAPQDTPRTPADSTEAAPSPSAVPATATPAAIPASTEPPPAPPAEAAPAADSAAAARPSAGEPPA